MIAFGNTLRETREAKGMTQSQLAKITHILPQIIADLEKDDVSRIVAPIYGRGFVKLICETLELDPQPLVEEFMAIYNGQREPSIRIKEESSALSTPAPTAPSAEPIDAMPPPITADAFRRAPITATRTPIATARPSVSTAPRVNPFSPPPRETPAPRMEAPAPAPAPAKPRSTYHPPRQTLPEVPRSVWRFALLGVAALAIIALLVLGCRAIYRATMSPIDDDSQATRTSESAPSPARSDKATEMPRNPAPTPPLYID